MKMSHLNQKAITHIIGWTIAVIAIYFSVRNLNVESIKSALESINTLWIYPIIVANFGVIGLKALRWQITFKPVKNIKMPLMFKVLTIGFMANNILPARLGDVVRIHLMGKDADVSRITTTTTLIADRIIEVISFLFLSTALILTTDVPKWMERGLSITLLITVATYTFAVIYSTRRIKHRFFKKLQDGIQSLRSPKMVILGLAASFLSWGLQVLMIYMAQMAFGVEIPIWGIVLVLIAVNLAVALPSAPSNIGTFEFACVLAYAYLGADKSLGLLIGITYHMLQVIPVTVAGGLILLSTYLKRPKIQLPDAA